MSSKYSRAFDPKESARYWWCKAYPENMVDDWEDQIGMILQLPYAYCIHDEDKLTTGEERKRHVHIIIAYGNTAKGSSALKVFQRLSKPGRSCLQKGHEIEPCNNIKFAYDYLIHDTEDARKHGKKVYDPSARVTGNNFDIGAYVTISSKEKNDMALELCMYIIDNKIMNFADFLTMSLEEKGGDVNYFEVIKSYSGLFDRTINGVWKKYKGVKDCEDDKGRTIGT